MQRAEATEFLSTKLEWILAILAEGRRTLSFPEATQWKALALTRWQLLQALQGFNECKKNLLITPLLASGDGEVSARAKRLEEHNDALQADYHAFVTRWSLTSPLSVTESYSAEARAMAARIERQVVADVQEVESLARMADGQ